MSTKSYYHFWHESYKQRAEKQLSFWKFIGLVRKHNIPTLAGDLGQVYERYFSDHPEEAHRRLNTELRKYIENGVSTHRDLEGFNATQRLKDAARKILHPDVTPSDFEKYWAHAMQNTWVLNLPQDDRLNTRNLFGRTHKICCDFHAER